MQVHNTHIRVYITACLTAYLVHTFLYTRGLGTGIWLQQGIRHYIEECFNLAQIFTLGVAEATAKDYKGYPLSPVPLGVATV